MTEEKLKKVFEHVDTFPERNGKLIEFQREVMERFTHIDSSLEAVRKASEHQDPSPKTLMMFETLQKQNERMERVIFGDRDDKDDKGIFGMVKELHTTLIKESGFWDRFFFISKVAGAVTAIAFLLAGMLAFIKKL